MSTCFSSGISLGFIFYVSLSLGVAQTPEASEESIDVLYDSALTRSNADSIFRFAGRIDSLSRITGYDYGQVKAKMLSAYYYTTKLKLDTAFVLLGDCEQFFLQNSLLKNTKEHGRMYLYMARARVRNREPTLARFYGLQGLKIFEQIGDKVYVMTMHSVLATAEYTRDNYALALEHYLAEYRTNLELGKPEPDHSSSLGNIANTFQIMGQKEKAISYARLAINAQSEAGNPSGLLYTFNTMGNIHKKFGNFDSALYYFNKVLTQAKAQKNATFEFVAMQNIASVHTDAGDFERSNDAIKTALTYSSAPPSWMISFAKSQKAKNFLGLKKYDSAIRIASIVYSEAKAKENKQMKLQTAEMLAKAFEGKRISDSALFYWKVHYIYKDSIYNTDNQKKFSRLYAEFETIEKQKQIELMQQQQALASAENRFLYVLIASSIITAALVILSLILRHRNQQKEERLKTYELQSELDQKKRDLHQQALRLIYINNGLTEVFNGLKKIKSEGNGTLHDVQQVINTMQINRSLEKEWENFDRYFGNVHTEFSAAVNQTFPQLTVMEKRLAGLIKMNLTNAEIASVLSIEVKSVTMAKYRLKKRLGLSEEQDVAMFLQNLK